METIIEFKQYADPRRNKNQNTYNSAIVHYKDDNIEWFATFDEDDRELSFNCSNGESRYTTYDDHGNKLHVQLACIDETGVEEFYGIYAYTWEYDDAHPNGILVKIEYGDL